MSERAAGAPPTAPLRALNDGRSIPAIGLGTAPMDDEHSEVAVARALAAGYRLIDTGSIYGNEIGVGRGVAASGVPREEITVLTKLRGRDQGYEATLTAFEESRLRLGLDYVDLYLIHWPLPRLDRFVDSWRAMIKLRQDGLARSIGVSNFLPEHLARLVDETGVLPSVNQIEVHPQFPQDELRAFGVDRGVQTISYSPLGRDANLMVSPVLADIAAAHEVCAAQVILRWHVQLGAVPIPRASSDARRAQNLDVFGFQLTEDELASIGTGFSHRRTGFDPAEHDEF